MTTPRKRKAPKQQQSATSELFGVRWKGDPRKILTPEQYERVARGDLRSVLAKISPSLYQPIPKSRAPKPQPQTLEEHRQLYAETGNPLWVWDGYRRCRRDNLEIPPWILAAFDDVATSVADLTAQAAREYIVTAADGRQHTRRDWQTRILGAFGFRNSKPARDRATARLHSSKADDRTAIMTWLAALDKVGGGQQDPIGAFVKEKEALRLAVLVRARVDGNGETVDRACALVAKLRGVSKSTARRAWKTLESVARATPLQTQRAQLAKDDDAT